MPNQEQRIENNSRYSLLFFDLYSLFTDGPTHAGRARYSAAKAAICAANEGGTTGAFASRPSASYELRVTSYE
jgi:hypothetical protein